MTTPCNDRTFGWWNPFIANASSRKIVMSLSSACRSENKEKSRLVGICCHRDLPASHEMYQNLETSEPPNLLQILFRSSKTDWISRGFRRVKLFEARQASIYLYFVFWMENDSLKQLELCFLRVLVKNQRTNVPLNFLLFCFLRNEENSLRSVLTATTTSPFSLLSSPL